MKSRTTLGSIAVVAALGLALTGCAGGQEKAEACQIFSDADQALAKEMSSNTSAMLSDPKDAVKSIKTGIGNFEESVSEITNEEIKEKIDALKPTLHDFTGTLSDMAGKITSDPTAIDPSAITDSAEAVQKAEKAVVEACNA